MNPTTLVTVVEENPDDANYQLLRDNLRRIRAARDQHDRYFRVVELPMPGLVEHQGQRLPAQGRFKKAGAPVCNRLFGPPKPQSRLQTGAPTAIAVHSSFLESAPEQRRPHPGGAAARNVRRKMAETMRAFIAATAPPEVVAQLEQVQEQLQAHCAAPVVRWTRAGQFHLTLKFLGNIPGDCLPELELALRRACQGAPSLHLGVKRLGCFPHAKSPRVLWVGFSGDVARLCGLQHRIEMETRGFGGPQEDRSFHPHLTLGRVNQAASSRELRRLTQALPTIKAGALGSWTISQIDLIQSRLSSEGAKYTTLASVSLAA